MILLPVSPLFAGWVTVNDAGNYPWYQFDDVNEDSVEDAGEAVQFFNSDTDALNDHDERALGTDPLNPDSDHDSLTDSDEVA